jgi:hypothetical protein
MTARWLFRVALLISLAAAAANADEVPARVFHIGIVAGTPRSSPERVAFEDRLRELGYVEGRRSIPTRWQGATLPVFRIRVAT